MVITYHGGQCIRVSFGDTTLVVDPASKQSKKLKPTRFGGDVVLISSQHPDFNGADGVARGDKTPFVISGPGEYEIGGMSVRGFASKTTYEKGTLNTIYLVRLEGMNLCFLGAISGNDLGTETRESLDDIDILFVPIGGDGVLTPADAHKISVKLEAKIVIPVHHGDMGMKEALKKFMKEEGSKGGRAVDKLTIKQKDLDGREGDIVVLKQQ